jgi:hypothetical protein
MKDNYDKDKQNEKASNMEDDDMNISIERHCSIKESIIESCKEIKLMQDQKLPKRSWDDFAKKYVMRLKRKRTKNEL